MFLVITFNVILSFVSRPIHVEGRYKCTFGALPSCLHLFLCLRTKCLRYAFGSVAEGILFLSCSSVRPCMRPFVRPETLLTRYLGEYVTHFHQTYINDTLWDRDKHTRSSHGGMKYAGKSTFWAY